MEFARKIMTCDCAYIAKRLKHEDNHDNCVYNRRFRDLIAEYPEHEDMLFRMWFLAVNVPSYGHVWDQLQNAYPYVPGLKDLRFLGRDNPQYDEIMNSLAGLPVNPSVSAYFNLDIYTKTDVNNRLGAVYDARIWELIECIGNGDCDYNIRKSPPVSEEMLSAWFTRPLTKSVHEAVSDQEVINFCEYLRYY